MSEVRINCWAAAYEADTLQIELVVNCLANMIGKTDGSMQLACLKLAGFGSLETEDDVNFSGLTYPLPSGCQLVVKGVNT